MRVTSDPEASKVCALVAALGDQEITLEELAEAVEPLTSEALQVIATLLRNCSTYDMQSSGKLWAARNFCQHLASTSRTLS